MTFCSRNDAGCNRGFTFSVEYWGLISRRVKPGMYNLFIQWAALHIKILSGPQNLKRFVSSENIGEEQNKGLHVLRRFVSSENIGKKHVFRRPVFTVNICRELRIDSEKFF